MRPTRRLSVSLLLGLLGAVLSPLPGWAAGRGALLAQADTTVPVRLVSQSAWNGIDRPLEITFQATNLTGAPLDQLSVELSIYAPARSRSLYELTLTSDATPLLAGFPFPEPGTLQPEETRTFRVGPQTLEVLQARAESALYPLKIELRSEDLPVATIRSPMIFLIEHPEVPLNLDWTWVLSEPLQYRPDGTFETGTIEADIARGGRLWAMARALVRSSSEQIDVVVSSVLIDQLQRMRDGYEIREAGGGTRVVPAGAGGAADAADLLDRLTKIAASDRTELLATPFPDPSLPALFRAGLAGDLKALSDRGHAMVASALDREPTRDVVRPYRSQLDPATLPRLELLGARTVLVDPNFLPAEKFASPPVMDLTSGSSQVAAILPNPELAALVGTTKADPVLAAHLALGELAAIWFELPGTSARGAAVLFGEDPGVPTAFFGPFASLVRHSPWLRPLTATGFVSIIAPAGRREVPPRTYPLFPPFYVNELLHTRASLGRFRQTADRAVDVELRLADDLQHAVAGTFVTESAGGLAFVASVQSQIRQTYAGVTIDTSVPVTLTSQAGLIPLVLTNDSGENLHVVLRLVADRRLHFVGGNTRDVTLVPGRRTLTVSVRAQATGRIPLKVQVLTSGALPDLVAEQTMVVRSTAYNRLALLVTIGAALFLLGWWGRRLLLRRRS